MYPALPTEAIREEIGSSMEAIVGSPIHPNASDAIVIPSCVAEMKEVGSASRRRAAWAR